jgi:eukaryotic-like serine/threonine-protein kinase
MTRVHDLDPSQVQRLMSLFDEALDQPDTQRAQWLSGLGERDPVLARLVAELLRHAGSQAPLDTSQLSQLLVQGHADSDVEGRQFGPYRALSLLGRGGMGSVWLAERVDGLFDRQVALKLLHPALATHTLTERFARERQILGALDHPNIAKLLDAGVSNDGQPYLAIEYVAGVSLTEHCAQQQLDLRARIALVMQMMRALEHAHRKLVLHRDIKPANILVTPDGQVRLLDFGIAKLMVDSHTHDTDLTHLGGRALTFEYASPEQIAGRPLGTASDVYSAGIVLYELLCGERPYSVAHGSPEAMEQALLAGSVIRPSQRVWTQGQTPALGITSRKLSRALRGDLDTIVLKAIKPHTSERYATIEAVMEDLQRYLDGRPVLARADSIVYRANRFVRRHRLGVAVAALLLTTLTAGLAGTLYQAARAQDMADRAEHQRNAALRELSFAEATEAFLRYLLSESPPEPLTPSQLLARAASILDTQYASDSSLRARLQLVVADLFGEHRDFAKAQSMLDQAQASALGSHDAALQSQLACRQASLRSARGEVAAGELEISALIASERARGAIDNTTLNECLAHRSYIFTRLDRPRDALADADEVLRALGAPTPARMTLVRSMHRVQAGAYAALGEVPKAVEIYQQELADAKKLGMRSATNDTATPNNLGVILRRSGQLLAASRAYEAGIEMSTVAGEPGDHALVINHARLAIELGRALESLPVLERATATSERAGDSLFHALGTYGLATAHCELQHWTQCDEQLARARELMQRVIPPQGAIWAGVALITARAAVARGSLGNALTLLRQACEHFEAAHERGYDLVRTLAVLVQVEAALGIADMTRDAQRAVTLAREGAHGFPHSAAMGNALLAQGRAENAAGHREAALQSWRAALDHLLVASGDQAVTTREVQALLASLN